MKKLKLKPGQLLQNLWRAYAVPAALAAVLCVLGVVETCMDVRFDTPEYKLLTRMVESCWLGLFLATAVCTLVKPGKLNYVLSAVAAAVGIALAMLLPYEVMLHGGLAMAALALCFHGVSRKDASAIRLNQVIGWGFATLGLTLVLWGALSVIVLAVFSLFFSGASYTAENIAYSVVMYLCLNLFAPWMFLGGLPTEDTPTDVRGAFRKFNARVLLPLSLLLMAVLLAYVAKIVVSWTMPVGTVNGFALAALCLFTFFHLTLTGEENKIARFFKNWCAWLMLPVLIAQQVGVWLRISAYGLTTARIAGIVVTLLCAGTVVTALLKKRANWFFVTAAAAAFVFISTPISAQNLARMDQESRLEAALLRNQMIAEDGSIVANANADEADQEIIWSAMNYLLYEDIPEDSIVMQMRSQLAELDDKDEQDNDGYPWYSRAAKQKLLGFAESTSGSNSQYWTITGGADHAELDVSGYTYAKWIAINEYESRDKTDDSAYVTEESNSETSYVHFDPLAAVSALQAAPTEAFVFPAIDMTCVIDGETIDLQPWLTNLVDQTDPAISYNHKFVLTDDQLTLPSGRVFHVSNISFTRYEYISFYSVNVNISGWLLTPEAE